MTPKDKNDWLFLAIIIGPMIIIPVVFGFFGVYNIATSIAGAMVGCLAGKISLMTGIVKNEVH